MAACPSHDCLSKLSKSRPFAQVNGHLSKRRRQGHLSTACQLLSRPLANCCQGHLPTACQLLSRPLVKCLPTAVKCLPTACQVLANCLSSACQLLVNCCQGHLSTACQLLSRLLTNC